MRIPSALESGEEVGPHFVLLVRQERKANIDQAHGSLRGRITLRVIGRRSGSYSTERREELGHDSPNQLLRVVRAPTEGNTVHVNDTTQDKRTQRRGIVPCAREEDEAVGMEIHRDANLVVPISGRVHTLRVEAPLRTRGAQRIRAKALVRETALALG